MTQPVKVLSVGGTDPCGAYGLVTDMKMFTALGAHGMGTVATVTAQNSVGWYGSQDITAVFVAQQLDAIFSDYGVEAVKTGFLGRADIVQVVADKLREYNIDKLVVDPVLVNQRGQRMFGDEVTAAYEAHLLPLATIITPNPDELAVLWSNDRDTPEVSVPGLANCYHTAVLLTGLEADTHLTDWLVHGRVQRTWSHPKLHTANTAGSGDALSAALTVFLAQGKRLDTAVAQAIATTQQALSRGAGWRLATGGGPLGIPGL